MSARIVCNDSATIGSTTLARSLVESGKTLSLYLSEEGEREREKDEIAKHVSCTARALRNFVPESVSSRRIRLVGLGGRSFYGSLDYLRL